LDILNHVSEPNLVQTQYQFNVYTILTIPPHLYDCGIWTTETKKYMKTKESRDEIHG